MALLLLIPDRNIEQLVRLIHACDPAIDIRIWPNSGQKSDIDYMVTWNHPRGELKKYPNLKAVLSFGAGVDHIVSDPDLPEYMMISRMIDPVLINDMNEFVVAVVLQQKRHLLTYKASQQKQIWHKITHYRNQVIAILGLGHIGKTVAETFVALRFTVLGWSRSLAQIPGVSCFCGQEGLDSLLPQVDYLVCLLPLTAETKNILNKRLFSKIKRGAYLINVGRGGHLNESDFLEALETGTLSGACLDVFNTEPLPADHPFWCHPNILITPHIASLTDPESCAKQIVENVHRIQSGKKPLHMINRELGY